MLALSISVPSKGTTINAAIADHVPVAELIPHLVDPTPGEHWVLHRAAGHVRPDHTLAQAGVRPGECLTLSLAAAPTAPQEAVEELSGPVGRNYAAWVAAIIIGLVALSSPPRWRPVDMPEELPLGSGVVELTVLAALLCAAGSLYLRPFVIVAALLGFSAGLHINVFVACLCALVLVWRAGPVRVVCGVLTIFAAVNFFPALTLVLALLAFAYAGQLAIGLAGIKLPKVPATGLFTPSEPTRAGNVIDVHSAVLVGLCITILACVYQLVPWSSQPGPWTIALLVCLALMGLSVRGTRPVHATVTAATAGLIVLWLALHVPLGFIAVALVGIPAIRISSPTVGRVTDAVEALAFCAAIPLTLHHTGLFEFLRGLGS
ncbi:MAG TPA: EsaB/YukD family protein [Candidatus Corynebacterium gallistercoris]|uniref:EsaB/YukD family protein n=1 Tax=Candidatus Corynebacterium gallistercoris TaxID=2838530 RepID=A0A9D1UQN3_9CORY|nr:EsaB/YukD family protein [Candidatus Corynebacterium gallistercoris]